MNTISRVCLCFLGVVLQVIAVEAKKGGGGGGGKSKGKKVEIEGAGPIGGLAVGILAVIFALLWYARKYLRRSKDDRAGPDVVSKDHDFERNPVGGYPPQDPPGYPTSPPPVQYSQMDWKREGSPVPPQLVPVRPVTPQFVPPHHPTPQFHPAPPSFPPTPYMGAAYTPGQYSPTPPFQTPHSPPMQYPPMQPAPGYGR